MLFEREMITSLRPRTTPRAVSKYCYFRVGISLSNQLEVGLNRGREDRCEKLCVSSLDFELAERSC